MTFSGLHPHEDKLEDIVSLHVPVEKKRLADHLFAAQFVMLALRKPGHLMEKIYENSKRTSRQGRDAHPQTGGGSV